MMSEFANQPLFLGILPCFLCNSIIDIFESLIQIISDSINHRYSIYIIDIESFYSILYQGITLQKYFLLFVLSLSRWLPPSLPSPSLLSFNHNIAQQRSRIQIYIIILLLGSMGFCCCATWYSNWMLNRDFRLMIRVEYLSLRASARAWLTGSASIPETNRENLEESLRARFFPRSLGSSR